MSDDELIASFVHFSDFHLGEMIYDHGGPELNIKDQIIEGIREKRYPYLNLQKHSDDIAINLSDELEACREIDGENVYLDKSDAFFLTGDIVTDAYDETIINNFAYPYFTSKDLDTKPDHPYSTKFGLGIDPAKLFPIPGNHEKHMNNILRGYEKSNFCKNFQSNTFSKYQKLDYEHCLVIKGHPFLIFGLDSNYYKDKVFAEGEISRAQENWVKSKMENYKKNGVESDGRKFLFDECTKILLIHHCPKDINPKKFWPSPKNIFQKLNYNSHAIKNDKTFIDFFKNNFDMGFCGHLHKDYFELLDDETPLIMAGTATEWSDPLIEDEYNSFNFIQVYSSKKIKLTVLTNKKRFDRFEIEKTESFELKN